MAFEKPLKAFKRPFKGLSKAFKRPVKRLQKAFSLHLTKQQTMRGSGNDRLHHSLNRNAKKLHTQTGFFKNRVGVCRLALALQEAVNTPINGYLSVHAARQHDAAGRPRDGVRGKRQNPAGESRQL